MTWVNYSLYLEIFIMKEHLYNNQQVLTAIKKLFPKEKVDEIQEILNPESGAKRPYFIT